MSVLVVEYLGGASSFLMFWLSFWKCVRCCCFHVFEFVGFEWQRIKKADIAGPSSVVFQLSKKAGKIEKVAREVRKDGAAFFMAWASSPAGNSGRAGGSCFGEGREFLGFFCVGFFFGFMLSRVVNEGTQTAAVVVARCC